MILEVIQLFLVAFSLNALWEFLHRCLYQECERHLNPRVAKHTAWLAGRDAAIILTLYGLTVLLFGTWDILRNPLQLCVFVVFSIIAAFLDEQFGIRMKQWNYSKNMPTVFGVGISPLIELGLTGILTFLLTF